MSPDWKLQNYNIEFLPKTKDTTSFFGLQSLLNQDPPVCVSNVDPKLLLSLVAYDRAGQGSIETPAVGIFRGGSKDTEEPGIVCRDTHELYDTVEDLLSYVPVSIISTF